MKDVLELSLLLDYYGAFLTENQRELIALSCEEDLSLSEIAEQKGISRQGVRDSIARGEKTLVEMENKLHLIERDEKLSACIRAITGCAAAAAQGASGETAAALAEMQAHLQQLTDLLEV